jgi:glycosyltransferase involved in cell wall biosynthesis
MSGGLVSIVIPTYNRAYCLGRAIDSVRAQTYPNFEIIIVDDGSTDETRALVEGLAGSDGRVRYFYQANAGVSAARNRGLGEVRGDYVALLDSDDVWLPWKLEVQLACQDFLPQAGMIWTDMEAVGPDGRVVNPKYLRTMYDAYRWFTSEQLFSASDPLDRVMTRPAGVPPATLYVGDIFSPMVVGNLVHTSTVVMRRALLERVGGFDEGLRVAGEDHDFHARTCREGPVAFLDLSSIQYQVGMPDRLSQHTRMVAINYLQTVQRRLREDRDRIRLPRRTINRVVARAHGWVGTELWYAGERREARSHLAASLWRWPWQPRTAAMLLLACLPRSASGALVGLYHRIKGRLRGRPGVGTA